MDNLTAAPVLSTPDDINSNTVKTVEQSHTSALSDEELDLQYEIKRTVEEIRTRRWKRIALQFPDNLLVDAPRVFDRLNARLASSRRLATQAPSTPSVEPGSEDTKAASAPADDIEAESLTILGDTSYGACCVDEIAAEHASADGIVHYGRSCLSPTQRLEVIYVFTSRPLDHAAALQAITTTFPDPNSKICLLADVPWQHHIPILAQTLKQQGYAQLLAPDLDHDPSSPIPNRSLTLPPVTEESLHEYSIFHIATPPTALVLALMSRRPQHQHSCVVAMPPFCGLSSATVIGILINTLSVKNYMAALNHVQSLIDDAGKKAYTFVVGKLNPAKLANFAEIDGWVVIGCWESSLIDSKEFLVPVITPFELEIALMKDDARVWGQQWISDFQRLLQKRQTNDAAAAIGDSSEEQEQEASEQSDDEPPDFDLRTGRYISRPRAPRRRALASHTANDPTAISTATSSVLVQRAKGDVARINGVASLGAEFLRTKREWQGLGSDFEIEYDRDGEGNIQGAAMEEGRSGVAKGYTHIHIETQT